MKIKLKHIIPSATLLLLAGGGVAACTSASAKGSASANEEDSPSSYVSTLVGTQSKHSLSTGNTYPAVALPWG